MKRSGITIILLIFALMIVADISFGDIIAEYGLKGGLSIMKIKSSDTQDSDSIVKPCFGAYLTVNYENGFAIQPELLLLMKGGKTDYSTYGILAVEEDVYTYLEVPVLAKYRLNSNDNIGLSIFAGPSIGMLLGTHYKLTGYDADYLAYLLGINTEGTAKDLGIDTNTFEFSLQFGTGMDFEIRSGTLTVDARYCIGLTNVIDTNPEVGNKNNGFIIMAGYTF